MYVPMLLSSAFWNPDVFAIVIDYLEAQQPPFDPFALFHSPMQSQ